MVGDRRLGGGSQPITDNRPASTGGRLLLLTPLLYQYYNPSHQPSRGATHA